MAEPSSHAKPCAGGQGASSEGLMALLLAEAAPDLAARPIEPGDDTQQMMHKRKAKDMNFKEESLEDEPAPKRLREVFQNVLSRGAPSTTASSQWSGSTNTYSDAASDTESETSEAEAEPVHNPYMSYEEQRAPKMEIRLRRDQCTDAQLLPAPATPPTAVPSFIRSPASPVHTQNDKVGPLIGSSIPAAGLKVKLGKEPEGPICKPPFTMPPPITPAKPHAKPIAKPTPKPIAKPAAKPVAKPMPKAKPAAKAEPKPAAKTKSNRKQMTEEEAMMNEMPDPGETGWVVFQENFNSDIRVLRCRVLEIFDDLEKAEVIDAEGEVYRLDWDGIFVHKAAAEKYRQILRNERQKVAALESSVSSAKPVKPSPKKAPVTPTKAKQPPAKKTEKTTPKKVEKTAKPAAPAAPAAPTQAIPQPVPGRGETGWAVYQDSDDEVKQAAIKVIDISPKKDRVCVDKLDGSGERFWVARHGVFILKKDAGQFFRQQRQALQAPAKPRRGRPPKHKKKTAPAADKVRAKPPPALRPGVASHGPKKTAPNPRSQLIGQRVSSDSESDGSSAPTHKKGSEHKRPIGQPSPKKDPQHMPTEAPAEVVGWKRKRPRWESSSDEGDFQKEVTVNSLLTLHHGVPHSEPPASGKVTDITSTNHVPSVPLPDAEKPRDVTEKSTTDVEKGPTQEEPPEVKDAMDTSDDHLRGVEPEAPTASSPPADPMSPPRSPAPHLQQHNVPDNSGEEHSPTSPPSQPLGLNTTVPPLGTSLATSDTSSEVPDDEAMPEEPLPELPSGLVDQSISSMGPVDVNEEATPDADDVALLELPLGAPTEFLEPYKPTVKDEDEDLDAWAADVIADVTAELTKTLPPLQPPQPSGVLFSTPVKIEPVELSSVKSSTLGPTPSDGFISAKGKADIIASERPCNYPSPAAVCGVGNESSDDGQSSSEGAVNGSPHSPHAPSSDELAGVDDMVAAMSPPPIPDTHQKRDSQGHSVSGAASRSSEVPPRHSSGWSKTDVSHRSSIDQAPGHPSKKTQSTSKPRHRSPTSPPEARMHSPYTSDDMGSGRDRRSGSKNRQAAESVEQAPDETDIFKDVFKAWQPRDVAGDAPPPSLWKEAKQLMNWAEEPVGGPRFKGADGTGSWREVNDRHVGNTSSRIVLDSRFDGLAQRHRRQAPDNRTSTSSQRDWQEMSLGPIEGSSPAHGDDRWVDSSENKCPSIPCSEHGDFPKSEPGTKLPKSDVANSSSSSSSKRNSPRPSSRGRKDDWGTRSSAEAHPYHLPVFSSRPRTTARSPDARQSPDARRSPDIRRPSDGRRSPERSCDRGRRAGEEERQSSPRRRPDAGRHESPVRKVPHWEWQRSLSQAQDRAPSVSLQPRHARRPYLDTAERIWEPFDRCPADKKAFHRKSNGDDHYGHHYHGDRRGRRSKSRHNDSRHDAPSKVDRRERYDKPDDDRSECSGRRWDTDRGTRPYDARNDHRPRYGTLQGFLPPWVAPARSRCFDTAPAHSTSKTHVNTWDHRERDCPSDRSSQRRPSSRPDRSPSPAGGSAEPPQNVGRDHLTKKS